MMLRLASRLRYYRVMAASLSALIVLATWGSVVSAADVSAASDTRLVQYLQKRFRIADSKRITLGPPTPSPFPGITSRTVTVSSEPGQNVTVTLFTDSSQKHVIMGQMLDTTSDPWDRINTKLLHLDDRPTLGPADAPITIVEFADFECPYCAHALDTVETAVNSRYRGKTKLIYKYFPLQAHPWAKNAAIAAECARLQNPDAFWEFARDFYRDQASIDSNNLRQHIDDYSARAGLDSTALNACMLSKGPEQRIKQDMDDGQALHLTSTPTFFINGIPLVGDPDDTTLDFVINAAFAAQEKHTKTAAGS